MVDIIIPVYNVSLYLQKCLDSVLRQTYKDIHIIIVDDGSTDGSSSICDEYSQYDNVTIIHQKNGGLSAARNAGLEKSNGDFVMFIDSDDWIESNTVEILLKVLEQNDGDIACSRFFFEYENKTICTSPQKGEIKIFNQVEALKEVLAKRSIGYAAWGKIYKRSLFDDINFPVGKIHEDIPVTPKLFLKCNRIVTTDMALFHYRQQEGSLSRGLYKKTHYDLYQFSVSNHYLVNIYPSLNDAYYASHYTACKDLLTLFKTKELKKEFASDYALYFNEIKNNVVDILRNNILSAKEKISILSVLFPFRDKLKYILK